MMLGAVLVFVVLGLFLRLRMAIWVLIGLPIAFFGAALMMPWVDVTINIISLFAFILVLGIVVDDAIIIAESVHTQTERDGYNLHNIVAGVHNALRCRQHLACSRPLWLSRQCCWLQARPQV